MQVRKRDGRMEEYDREKLRGSLLAAGVSPEQAEGLTSKVESWMMSAADNDVIGSQGIWEQVVTVLEEADPSSAERYKAFRR